MSLGTPRAVRPWMLVPLAALVLSPAAGGPMRGMTFSAWYPGEYAAPEAARQLAEVSALGVDTVALVAQGWQDGRRATEVRVRPDLSPGVDELRDTIRAARRLGLAVVLKPQVDFTPGNDGWRGEIAFDAEQDWRAWFASYSEFIGTWAGVAEEEGVAILCVGVELDGTRHREDDWRSVVAVARTRFHGRLTYAANFDRETDIAWWDALDLLGVDAYYPLGDRDDLSVEALCANWAPHRERLRQWAERWGRPVLFTEIGYRSAVGAVAHPWEWADRREVDLDVQARLYEAALATFWGEPWFAGALWWQWRAAPPPDPEASDGFGVRGKPAAAVLRRYYSSREP